MIKMFFDNPQYAQARQYYYIKQQQLLQNQQASKRYTSLKTPMIDRIHNIKPGCGGCGK
jgi:hypothetical protein